jgi:TPP-dependent pyruvate/acetoin dehydrogenase alpha subunit
MSDPGITYRNKEEVGEVRKSSDPIVLLKKIIVDNNVMD